MQRLIRPRYRLAVLLLLLVVAACDGDSDPTPTPADTEGTGAAATATPARTSPAAPVIALDLASTTEAETARQRLVSAGFQVSTFDEGLPVPYRITDGGDGAHRYVLDYWSLAAGQWADVHALTSAEVRRLFAGEVTDWAELGGLSRPIDLYIDAAIAGHVRDALGVASSPATELPLDELLDTVAANDSAIALLPTEALRPGLLALEVDGHDPYRLPWLESPLRLERSIDAPDRAVAGEIADALNWQPAPDVRPISTVATGEVIPVRCSQPSLEIHGHEAMFDAVRDYFARADLVIAQLEPSLTTHEAITPCTRPTFILQASHETARAMANAHIDVVFAIGNHIGDCWRGCPAGEAMLETIEHVDNAGLLRVGLGENLEDARTPRFLEIEGVTFAFLGFEDIAYPWFGAGPNYPGVVPADPATIAGEVAAAAEQADHVIVGMNWGDEYVASPNARQRRAAQAAVDAGASLVIGNHPHWVQAVQHVEFEDRATAVVFYALGNFIFDQTWSVPTQQGAFVEIGILPDRILGYRLHPVFIEGSYQPTPVDLTSRHGRDVLDRTRDASRALEGQQ